LYHALYMTKGRVREKGELKLFALDLKLNPKHLLEYRELFRGSMFGLLVINIG
jgi:hypothetical protein